MQRLVEFGWPDGHRMCSQNRAPMIAAKLQSLCNSSMRDKSGTMARRIQTASRMTSGEDGTGRNVEEEEGSGAEIEKGSETILGKTAIEVEIETANPMIVETEIVGTETGIV